MKAAILCTHYKLAVFTRHLTEGGFVIEKRTPTVIGGESLFVLNVPYELPQQQKLAQICLAAQAECRKLKRP
ncbi:MAG: hypothetical protein JWR85_4207 [Marmoricola sp.]|nr:hypothetical protein [Marmoricola sp.]